MKKNELFFYIQQKRQTTLFDNSSEYSSSVEGNLISKKDIELKLNSYLQECPKEVKYTKFICDFFNNYGLLCEFQVLNNILEQMENRRQIEIIRNPPTTKNEKPAKFWKEVESEQKTITIRRLKT